MSVAWPWRINGQADYRVRKCFSEGNLGKRKSQWVTRGKAEPVKPMTSMQIGENWCSAVWAPIWRVGTAQAAVSLLGLDVFVVHVCTALCTRLCEREEALELPLSPNYLFCFAFSLEIAPNYLLCFAFSLEISILSNCNVLNQKLLRPCNPTNYFLCNPCFWWQIQEDSSWVKWNGVAGINLT